MFETVVAMRGTVYEKGYGLIAQKAMRDKNLSSKAKTIYAYLCSFAGSGEERSAFPGVDMMMDELGFKSKDTFYKFRNELEQAGYISIEKDKDERGRFMRCVYRIEAFVTPKQPLPKNQDGDSPYPKNQDTENWDTENKDAISINSKSINLNNDCLIGAAEIVAASEQVSSSLESAESYEIEIYEALQEHVPKNCFVNGIPLGMAAIAEFYLMLIKQFQNRLSPEVVRIACQLYYDRSQGIAVSNPTGFFQVAYGDAVKLWKAKRNKGGGHL
ncbi:helix-turn-helix domain-containing protein [Paenibacillus solisilvae]|uniref:Helix-turn-helix domain-containing protein n=1 Tax=Paenibacillus solisilvae TaxID=2486751 RepID=A0ABW0WAU6_9BACL